MRVDSWHDVKCHSWIFLHSRVIQLPVNVKQEATQLTKDTFTLYHSRLMVLSVHTSDLMQDDRVMKLQLISIKPETVIELQLYLK